MYKDAKKSKLSEFNSCPLKKQHSIMFAFDILIYNDDRNMGNALYSLDDCRLWMIDHTQAFRIINRISKNLPKRKIRLSEEFATKLRQLNYPLLDEHVGKYLNKYQMKYIIKRRDLILKKWQEDGKPGFRNN